MQHEAHQEGTVYQNLQLGFVQIYEEPLADPVFQSFKVHNSHPFQNADSIRLWAKHFSPTGSKDPVIPQEWLWFFTNLLVTPSQFSWAKDFLTSKAWDIFNSQSIGHSMTFSLSQQCPTSHSPSCAYLEELQNHEEAPRLRSSMEMEAEANEEGSRVSKNAVMEEEVHGDDSEKEELDQEMIDHTEVDTPVMATITSTEGCQSSSALHKNRKRQRQPPMVETEVRHSDRLKDQNNGYKRNRYPHKDCFACSGAPPTLSSSVIKNLGTKFCSTKPEALSKEALQKKEKKKAVIKKPTGKQAAKKEGKKSPNGKKDNKKAGN